MCLIVRKIRCLQFRNYLQTHQEWDKLSTPPSDMGHFFMLTIRGTIKKKIISHIYKILQDYPMDNSSDVKKKWELEISTIISDEKWEQPCREGHKVTNSPTRKEFKCKVKMRYFRTPCSFRIWGHLGSWPEGLWLGRRPNTYNLGLSKITSILARHTKWN